jgi:hypothetical protein
MAVDYHGRKFNNNHGGKLKNCGKLLGYFNPKNRGTAIT